MNCLHRLLAQLLSTAGKILETIAFHLFRPSAILHKTHLTYSQSWFLAWKSRFTVLPLEFRLPLKHPRLLISGWGWSQLNDNTWRDYAAKGMERGSKLIAVQHGGGYGMRAFSQCEVDQIRVADEFWGWGWAERNVALPPMKLKRKPKNILFISGGRMTPICRLDSEPLFDKEWKQHFDWQERFFERLGHDRTAVLYRPYPESCNADGEQRILQRFPDLTVDRSKKTPWNKAWLVVIDHCATSMLYALALNIPTILFWNPQAWPIRDEAKWYFKALHECGILQYSPEAAAHHVRTFHNEWWDSRWVQAIRTQFVKRFAWTERDWTRSWIENIKRVGRGT